MPNFRTQYNKDIPLKEWMEVNRLLIAYKNGFGNLRFTEPLADHNFDNRQALKEVLRNSILCYVSLRDMLQAHENKGEKDVYSLREAVQALEKDFKDRGFDVNVIQSVDYSMIADSLEGDFVLLSQSSVAYQKVLHDVNVANRWKEESVIDVVGFVYEDPNKEEQSADDVEATLDEEEDREANKAQEEQEELEAAMDEGTLSAFRNNEAAEDALAKKKLSENRAKVLNALPDEQAHIPFDQLTGFWQAGTFAIGNFSRDFMSTLKMDTDAIESQDYTLEQYKKALVNMMKMENYDLVVSGGDKIVSNEVGKNKLIANTYVNTRSASMKQEVTFMSRREVIDRYREIERTALSKVLGGGNARNAHFAFLDKEKLENGNLAFDLDKIEAARHVLTDDEIYAIYTDKIKGSDFVDDLEDMLDDLPKLNKDGAYLHSKTADNNKVVDAMTRLHALEQIHKSRGFFFPLLHPFQNHDENVAIEKLTARLKAFGISENQLEAVRNGSDEACQNAGEELYVALEEKRVKQLVFDANQKANDDVEKKMNDIQRDAVFNHLVDKSKEFETAMNVTLDLDRDDLSLRTGIAETLKTAVKAYYHFMLLQKEEDALGHAVNADKAKEGMRAVLIELDRKHVKPDFIQNMQTRRVFSSTEYSLMADEILHGIQKEDKELLNAWTKGTRDISDDRFTPNEEWEQKELEDWISKKVLEDAAEAEIQRDQFLEAEPLLFKDGKDEIVEAAPEEEPEEELGDSMDF